MKVLTLDSKGFRDACGCLQQTVENAGFAPDVVLGIENGGRHVAELMFASVPHAYVALHRPSTANKGNVFRRVVGLLPDRLNDALRHLESTILNMRKARPKTFGGTLPPELNGARSILVVDDAVDSGATMQAVVRAVHETYPRVDVKCAAMTVTTRRPLIWPDFSLYACLIRFPWSADAKN